jgi:23S rRNA (uracil1939-C5)-methyltransferase
MGRTKQKPLLENLLITDIAAEGKAIARFEGMIVFVSDCVPGDVVDVQIIRKRKRYAEGFPVKYHAYSENRTVPFCSHFGLCGGCKWQHLPYVDQLKSKQKWVADSMERIGKVEGSVINPALGSEKLTEYRNKLEFTFSHHRWLTKEEIQSGDSLPERRALGFHIPGKFDKVLDIVHCYLQPEPSNAIRNFVRQYAIDHGLEFFDIVRKEGFLRNLTIRNTVSGDVMLIFSFYRDDREDIENLLTAIAGQFPQITSLMYVINSKANDTINDLEVIRFSGNDHLVETMENLKFRISPKSFFQTNTTQAYRLYSIARDLAGLTGDEIVYDLYTGTGTIALFLAAGCKKVIGMENVAEAIEDAKRNALLNGISNAEFFTGDIRELMNGSFFLHHGYPDVLITDPPRTGMHEDVVKAILEAKPRRIVYVSCNPATQARDIEWLSSQYKVQKCQPVDMFPYTQHVENVTLLHLLEDFGKISVDTANIIPFL